MITRIRPATHGDLPQVMEIYAIARDFMRRTGNASQWIEGYPSTVYITEEIGAGHSFVCENQDGELVGTFCFMMGEDPTYKKIYEGEWLNSDPYGTVHRLASAGKEKGVAEACFRWCFEQCPNIRVDTHRDNRVMRQILDKLRFTRCGVIYVSNGTERLAYQKVV
ncbi:GNAT family N-acetyltransferase [Proteiniphilum sp. X52]|uniref:GNAT family N-acetyltransferase n=1 Tax=Proteiniphilum sp. X52 TaxID=2382159 RepID=UPI000F0A13F7|nr:GNAT family N-acetyltransferase [Proteiniphilum sp. X52]RNC64364.1 GNAT family N-acetyltransferase [Proteiniphilum sp. X52]